MGPVTRLVQDINRFREKLKVRLRLNISLSTEFPSDLVEMVAMYLPSSLEPPELTSNLKKDSVSEKLKDEISALIQGKAFASDMCSVYTISRNPRHLHVFLNAFKSGNDQLSTKDPTQLEIWLPENYPDSSPKYRYLTRVNELKGVSKHGEPDLDQFLGGWTQGFNLSLLITAFYAHRSLNSEHGKKCQTLKIDPVSAEKKIQKNLALTETEVQCYAPEYRYAL